MQKTSKKLLLLTHINPFSGYSGQSQRVRYTLMALQQDFDVTVLFGTYSEKDKNTFLEGLRLSKFNVSPVVVKFKRSFVDNIGAAFVEYFIGLKSSNYFIARLFAFERLKKQVDFSNYDIVFFEYWHAYKTAGQLRTHYPHLVTICDTHNILSATYDLYLKAHPIKKYLSSLYQKQYRNIEFKRALPSFHHIIAINLVEHNILTEALGQARVFYCPMGVDLTLFSDATPYASKLPFVVLYYGGLGSGHNQVSAIDVYKKFVLPAVAEGLQVRFKIVGSNAPSDFAQHFDANLVDLVGFSSTLIDAFSGVALAIIPWKGKYGFRSRLIELSACGIPIFTTSDAVWGMGYKHEGTAFVFDEMNDSAYQYFKALYAGAGVLTNVSKKAAQFVNEQYDYEHTYVALSKRLQNMVLAST